MSGGVSSGGLRSGQGGQGTPTAPVNGGTGALGIVRAAGITKPEADVWYVNTDEAGDEMLGPLVVEGKLVALDPAEGNAATWTEDGLYVPPAEALPEELLTEAEGAALFAPLAHTTDPDPHAQYATDADLATLEGDTGAALTAHAADADAHGDYLTAGEADSLFLTPAEGDAAYASTGHTHPSEESAPWRFQDTTPIGTPGAGYLRTNTGVLSTASVIGLSRTTQDGYDIPPPGWGVTAGDTIFVQDRDDSTKWVRYEALEPLTSFPTYATGVVEVTGSAGSIANGQIVQVTFSLAGGGGGGGAGAVTSVNGETGAVVLDAADVGALTQTAGDARYVQQSAQSHNHTAAEASGALTNDEHDGYSQYTNLGSDPTTPVTNRIRLYSKDNGSGIATLYYRTESGDIYELPTLTPSGGGSGAPSNATYITTTAESKLSQERVLGTAVIMAGTLASRPAFGTAGRVYLATDDATVYRDTGSAWQTFARSEPRISVQSTEPASPATGDLWVW